MKKLYQFIFTVLASTLFLSTAQAKDDTAVMLDTLKHLKEKDAKILMTINKDFTSTKINVNTGERMKPCRTDIPKGKSLKELRDVIAECLPKGHKNGIGEVQVHGEYMLFKGSECFADVVGGYLFVYCQPPEDLGF